MIIKSGKYINFLLETPKDFTTSKSVLINYSLPLYNICDILTVSIRIKICYSIYYYSIT